MQICVRDKAEKIGNQKYFLQTKYYASRYTIKRAKISFYLD